MKTILDTFSKNDPKHFLNNGVLVVSIPSCSHAALPFKTRSVSLSERIFKPFTAKTYENTGMLIAVLSQSYNLVNYNMILYNGGTTLNILNTVTTQTVCRGERWPMEEVPLGEQRSRQRREITTCNNIVLPSTKGHTHSIAQTACRGAKRRQC